MLIGNIILFDDWIESDRNKLDIVSLFPKSTYSGNGVLACCHLGNSNFDRFGQSIMPSLAKAQYATPNRTTSKHARWLDEPAPTDGYRLPDGGEQGSQGAPW